MKCLVYLPHSYTGRGPAESCVRIIEHFAAQGIEATLFVARLRAEVSPSITVVEGAFGPLRQAPYRFVSRLLQSRLQRQFRRAVDRAEPGSIAYFWPDTPASLVVYAKSRGMICVREMINSPLAHSKPVLDAAYSAAGLPPTHSISGAMVAEETRELALYDFVFSSNAEVDAALARLNIPKERVLNTSFGWVGGRFAGSDVGSDAVGAAGDQTGEFRAVFVGLMNVRKGIPTLIEAWDKAQTGGKLLLAGSVEECLQPMVSQFCERADVEHLGHVSDVASLYRSCDAFVFPTHEEGGPQVTYEAAACGTPVVTTPMGAARLVEDGVSGLICPAGDAQALAKALSQLAQSGELRDELAQAASGRVDAFEYAQVGAQRAALLKGAVEIGPKGGQV